MFIIYSKVKLTIVIVNYNVKFYLEQCLISLRRALAGISAEVYVVDNHSKDHSVEYLSEHFPEIHIIDSPHNLGFARANNLAIGKSEAEYVLLLNPDTVVGEQTIKEAVLFMDEHPDAGALGVRMLDANGRSAKESRRGMPTPMVSFYKMVGLCARFPKHPKLGHYYMGDLPWDKSARIEVVSGAFCMLRKKALDEVGYLDEDFFMYGEDIDLSYRVLKGGYHNYYLPSLILHYKGESTQKSSFRYVHVFYEAMLIFLKKHYSGLSILFTIPIKAAIYGKATLALLRMQMDKARRSLGFVDYNGNQPVYIFVGEKEMIEACRELVKKKGLGARFLLMGQGVDCEDNLLQTISNVIIDEDKMNYFVFDAEALSYNQIFSAFMCCPVEMKKMAFYYLSTGKLITDNDVIE